ncbi:MAG: MBL fold metallo-hydrolase [Deltaproteobacteria bacterium]|nr:MBL fold metallo-hydrolase [Deltaproteobacteria bacterium]
MTTKTERFRLTFLGAAQTVTGSMHLLEVGEGSLLVDCGLFQGARHESEQKNRNPPRKAPQADALVLTHAHIDHCGNLPTLVRRGFSGPIHCTSATAEVCEAMLRDSARIQVSDAAWLNRKHEDDPDWVEILPLYTEEDVDATVPLLTAHEYGDRFGVIPGVTAHFVDAGHILGSASAILDVKVNAHSRRIVFSGDIGRRHLPILRDPVIPEHADYVVMESTYGDRLHAPAEDMQTQLLEAIETTRKRGGKVIIPTFALERAQEIVYALNQLLKGGRLQPIPVYLDSPLAVNLVEVFRRHDECFDPETTDFLENHGDPFGFHLLTLVESTDDSRKLNDLHHPAVILSASGMCESGRILHHLRNNIEDPKNTILIVGFQAQHTLGRRLVERRPEVRIFGVMRELKAEVRVLNAFSAHADKHELLWWAEGCGRQVREFFLVHGEPVQSEAFAEVLRERGRKVRVPGPGETADLDR